MSEPASGPESHEERLHSSGGRNLLVSSALKPTSKEVLEQRSSKSSFRQKLFGNPDSSISSVALSHAANTMTTSALNLSQDFPPRSLTSHSDREGKSAMRYHQLNHESDIFLLSQSNTKLQHELSDSVLRLKTCKEELRDAERKLKEVEGARRELQKTSVNLREENEQLRVQLEKVKVRETDSAKIDLEIIQENKSLRNELETLRRSLEVYKKTVAEADEERFASRRQISALQDSFEKAEKEKIELQRQLSLQAIKMESEKMKFDNSTQECESLKEEMRTMRDRMESLEGTERKSRESWIVSAEKCNTVALELTETKMRLERIEEDKAELQEKLQQLEREQETQEEQRGKMAERLERFKKDLQDTKQERDELVLMLESCNIEKNMWEREYQRFMRQTMSFEQTVTSLNQHLESSFEFAHSIASVFQLQSQDCNLNKMLENILMELKDIEDLFAQGGDSASLKQKIAEVVSSQSECQTDRLHNEKILESQHVQVARRITTLEQTAAVVENQFVDIERGWQQLDNEMESLQKLLEKKNEMIADFEIRLSQEDANFKEYVNKSRASCLRKQSLLVKGNSLKTFQTWRQTIKKKKQQLFAVSKHREKLDLIHNKFVFATWRLVARERKARALRLRRAYFAIANVTAASSLLTWRLRLQRRRRKQQLCSHARERLRLRVLLSLVRAWRGSSETEKLRKKMMAENEEKESLRGRLEQKLAALSGQEEEAEKLKKMLSNIREEMEEERMEKMAMQGRMEGLEKILTEKNKQVEEAAREKAELISCCEKLKEEVKHKEKLLVEKDFMISELDQDQKVQKDSRVAHDAKTLALSSQVAALQAEAAKTESEKKEMSDLIASQKEQLEEVEMTLKEEQQRSEALMSKIEKLQGSLSKKGKELVKYQTEREEVEQGLVTANEKLMKKSRDLHEKEKRMFELQEQVERMEEEMAEQERRFRTSQQACEKLSGRLSDVQTELEESQHKRTSLVKECGQLKRRIDELEEELSRSEEKNAEMKRLRDERDMLKNRLLEVGLKLSETKSHKEDAESVAKDLQDEIASLRSKVSSLMDDLEKEKTRAAKLIDEIDVLRKDKDEQERSFKMREKEAVAELSKQLDEIREVARTQMQSVQSEHREQINNFMRRNRELEVKVSDHRLQHDEDVQSLNQLKKSLEVQTSQHKAEEERLNNRISFLQAELSKARNDNNQLSSEKEKLSVELSDCWDVRQRVEKSKSNLERQLEDHLAKMQQTSEEYRNYVEMYSTSQRELQKTQMELQQEREKLEHRTHVLANMTIEIESLRSSLSDNQKTLSEIKLQNNQLINRLEVAEADVLEKNQSLQQAKQECLAVTSLKQQISSSQQTIDELRSTLAVLAPAKEKLDQELSKLRTENSELQLREMEGEERVKQLEILLAAKRKSNDDTRRATEDIEKQLESLREIDKFQTQEIQVLRSELEKMRVTHAEKLTEMTKQTVELNKLIASNSELEIRSAHLQHKLSEVEEEMVKARSDVERWQNSFKGCKRKLQRLHAMWSTNASQLREMLMTMRCVDANGRPVILFCSSKEDEDSDQHVAAFALAVTFGTWSLRTQRRNKTVNRKLALAYHRLNRTSLDFFLAQGAPANFDLTAPRARRMFSGGAGKRLQQEMILCSNFFRANSLVLEFLKRHNGNVSIMRNSVLYRLSAHFFTVWKQLSRRMCELRKVFTYSQSKIFKHDMTDSGRFLNLWRQQVEQNSENMRLITTEAPQILEDLQESKKQVESLSEQMEEQSKKLKLVEDELAARILELQASKEHVGAMKEELLRFYSLPSPCGVGLTLETDMKGNKRISEIKQKLSAHTSGAFTLGDVILAVDGQSLVGMQLEAAQEMLQGARGSRVNITVQRGKQEFVVTLKRGSWGAEHSKVSYEENGEAARDATGLLRPHPSLVFSSSMMLTRRS